MKDRLGAFAILPKLCFRVRLLQAQQYTLLIEDHVFGEEFEKHQY